MATGTTNVGFEKQAIEAYENWIELSYEDYLQVYKSI